MKFKVFILSLVLALAACTVSYAASTVTSDGVGDAYQGSVIPADQTMIMAVNPGDTITIDIAGATDSITLISYKGSEPQPDNIQHLNQYSKNTTSISYIVRDISSTQNGLYLLRLNDGTTTYDFYYKVGRPLLDNNDNPDSSVNYYRRVDFGYDDGETEPTSDIYDGTTSVAYLATFTPAGDAVTKYGFSVKMNKDSTKSLDRSVEGNITGDGEFIFGITIFNMKPDNGKTVDQLISELVVTPYVNYSVENADA